MQNEDGFGIFILGTVIAGAIGWFACYAIHDGWKHEAVKHGAAEFYLDNQQARQWRWKELPR